MARRRQLRCALLHAVLVHVSIMLLASFVPHAGATLSATSVLPSPLHAGESSTVSVSFTSDTEISIGSYLVVDFPPGFLLDPSSATATVDSPVATATTLDIDTAESTSTRIRCTVSTAAIPAATAFLFSVSDVVNPASGETGVFSLSILDSTGATVNEDANIAAVAIVSTNFTSASVVPDSLDAGVSGTVSVAFKSAVGLPVSSIVGITVPAEFTIATTSSLSAALNIDATSMVITEPASSMILVTVAGVAIAAGADVSFKVDGVTNPGASTTGSFALATMDSSNRPYQTMASIAAMTIASTELVSASLSLDTTSAGVAVVLTMDVVTSVSIETGGHIVVTFPSEYSIATGLVVAEASGAFTVTGTIVTGQSATSTVSTAVTAGTYSLVLSNLRNPGVTTIGSFKIETTDSANRVLEYATVNGVSTSAGALIAARFRPSTPHPGISSNIELSFTTAAALVDDTLIYVTLPMNEYSQALMSPSVQVVSPTSATATITWDTPNPAFAVLVSPTATIPEGSVIELTITAFNLPPSIREEVTSGATIQTWNSASLRLDGPSVLTLDAITAVTGVAATCDTVFPYPGITSPVDLTFDVNGIIPIGGWIQLQLALSEFGVDSFPVLQVTSADERIVDATAEWDAATSQIQVTLPTLAVPAYSTGLRLRISALDTPQSIRAAARGPAWLSTYDSQGGLIDGPCALTLDEIKPGLILGERMWISSVPTAGVTSDQSISFLTTGKLSVGATIEFTLPDTGWGIDGGASVADFTAPPLGEVATVVWDATTHILIVLLTSAPLPAYSAVTFTVAGMKNPPKEMGVTLVSVSTRASDGEIVDGLSEITMNPITRGAFQGDKTLVSTTTTSASMASAQVLSLSLSGALPSGSIITLGFPAGGWRSASTTPSVSFLVPATGVSVDTDSIQWSEASSTLVFQTIGDLGEATAVQVQIDGLVNPFDTDAASDQSLSVKSTLLGGGVVDESLDILINAITADALPSSCTWVSTVPTPGVLSTQTLSLTTGGRLEIGATLKITLPVNDGWDVNAWSATAHCKMLLLSGGEEEADLTLEWSHVAATLKLTFTVAVPQQTTLEITITHVRSPPSERVAAVATLSLFSHLGGLVNTGLLGINAISRGQLSGERLWQSAYFTPGPVASLATTASLTFTTTGQIDSGATIVLQLPIEWELDPARCTSVQFFKPSVVGSATCLHNVLTIVLADRINEFSDVSVVVQGVINPPTVLPAGVATMKTVAVDGGVVDESTTVSTGAIEAALLEITADEGDARVAVVGVTKTFHFHGLSVASGDVVKFVDASTLSDANCGAATSGVSDVGGLEITQLDDDHSVRLRFTQASVEPFSLCYKFGSNPFKLYSNLAFTVKEITALTVNEGDVTVAVADYEKTWHFHGLGIDQGDLVRWIDASFVTDEALATSPPDCQDASMLAELVPPSPDGVTANEDAYTREMKPPAATSFPFAFSSRATTSGKTFYLCYKFKNEPFRIYTGIAISVRHVHSLAASSWGEDTVAVVDMAKPFTVHGDGVFLNDRLYFLAAGAATSCASDAALALPHTISEQSQSVLFVSANADTEINFASQAAGQIAMLCYQFGNEPFQLYANIQLNVKMVTLFTGARGSPRLAVAGVPEPLVFVGYGLRGGDQVRWIHSAEEATCDLHLATLVEPATLEPIDTVDVDIGLSAAFNFTAAQDDYSPALCYRFGSEQFKLYASLGIKIATLTGKATTIGSKEVAVAEARKIFTLYGTHLAERDRVSWTADATDTACVNASLLVPPSTGADTNYVSFTTLRHEVGVAFAARHSGDRVFLCYGFGSEPFKLYRDLYLDVKSVLRMRSLRGANDVAVAGAAKALLFEGDGVDTGDQAKFVPLSEIQDCTVPGVPVTNLQKEFDDAGEMAMYLYRNTPGITVGGFTFSEARTERSAAGLDRVLCYRFGSEAFFYYDSFRLDIKTIWALRHADATRAGQPSVAVVDQLKLIAIDGVGVAASDTVKWIEAAADSTDQDCEDRPAMGLVARTITVFANTTMWFPFEYGSASQPWTLCYKFDAEPFRLFTGITVMVKQLTELRDAVYRNSSTLGQVAVINQPKTWVALGAGILQGDRVKFVPLSVGNSDDCGLSSANTAGGSTLMTVGEDGRFTGAFTTVPAALADQYRVCYQFQDEPFAFVQGLQLATYGVVALSRKTLLAQATTPITLNGFRLSNTDRLGWTQGSDCTTAVNIVDVTEAEATLLFDTEFASLSLCYSFDRQPFTLFKSLSISVVGAEIWAPTTAALVAGQSQDIQVAGTFGLTVSSDQAAWVPSDALACSTDVMAAYASIMPVEVVATTASSSSLARAGSATLRTTFSPPRTTLSDSLSTWKLCYKFGNVPGFILFGDVLCDVLTVHKIDLLESTPTATGTTLTFQFEGIGVQDFDTAKWIDASSSSDSQCESQPAVSGSSAVAVVSGVATFAFTQQTSAMALCYKFLRQSSYKLFLNVPVTDRTAATAAAGASDSDSSSSSSSAFVLNQAVATLTLKLDKDITELPAGSPAESAFKTAFATAIAASLGIDAARIQIQELRAGSVIVKFQLLPSDNVAEPLVHELVEELQTQLLDETSALRTGAAAVLAIADPSTALTAQIDTSASALAPSLPVSSSSIAVKAYQSNGLFTFTTDAVSVTEKSSRLLVRVLRQQGTNAVITLPLSIQQATATATYGVDYAITSPSSVDLSSMFLRFDIGDSVKVIEIEIVDDAVKEAHFELFTLVLGDPGAPTSALGAFPLTTVRIYDWDDGVVAVEASFPAKIDRRFNLLGWQVVHNGASPASALRVDANGLFAIDQVVGDAEYDQKCDLAAPTGACAFACDTGASLGDVAATYKVLRLHGDASSYAITATQLSTFPTRALTLSFWMRTTSQSLDACVLSYAAPLATGRVHLAVCNPTNLHLSVDSLLPAATPAKVNGALATFVDVADGAWHFVAITWSSDDGRAQVFDNGMLAFDGGPYRVGHSLAADGFLVVGQLLDPTRPCSSASTCAIVAGHSLDAELQHVHVWTRELGRSELMKELQWPHKVVTNGLLLGWDFDTVVDGDAVVTDVSTRGVQQKNNGQIVCGEDKQCVVPGVLPTLSKSFPCGPVYANIWHFSAPAAFVQALASSYGGRLQFRMLAPSRNGVARPRRGQISIFSDRGHATLGLGGFPLPSSSGWTYYSAILREDFGWVQEPSGDTITTSEFKDILSSTTALWIRGDLWGPDATSQGQEVVYLNDIKVFAR